MQIDGFTIVYGQTEIKNLPNTYRAKSRKKIKTPLNVLYVLGSRLENLRSTKIDLYNILETFRNF